MKTLLFHQEVVEGAARVQIGPFGEVLENGLAKVLADAACDLGGLDCGDSGSVLFKCIERRAEDISRKCEGLGGVNVTRYGGAIRRALRLRSCLVEIQGIAMHKLPQAIELCWGYAPLFFGLRDNGVALNREMVPDLDRTIIPNVEFLKAWRSLCGVFYHGAWVGFSACRLGGDAMQGRVLNVFRQSGLQCESSAEPM